MKTKIIIMSNTNEVDELKFLLPVVRELYDFGNENIAINGLVAESCCLGAPYAGKKPTTASAPGTPFFR